jgi:cell division protein FtsB
MNFAGPSFIVAIVALSMGAWVITTWMRARYGYPLTDDNGNTVHRSDPDAGRKIDLLSNENEKLTGRISRLEDRIAVLERIATDPAARTAREIDALR